MTKPDLKKIKAYCDAAHGDNASFSSDEDELFFSEAIDDLPAVVEYAEQLESRIKALQPICEKHREYKTGVLYCPKCSDESHPTTRRAK